MCVNAWGSFWKTILNFNNLKYQRWNAQLDCHLNFTELEDEVAPWDVVMFHVGQHHFASRLRPRDLNLKDHQVFTIMLGWSLSDCNWGHGITKILTPAYSSCTNWDDHPSGLNPHHLPSNSSKYTGNLYIFAHEHILPSGNHVQTLTFQLTWQVYPGSTGSRRLAVRGEKQPHGPTAVEVWPEFFTVGWKGRRFQWMDLFSKNPLCRIFCWAIAIYIYTLYTICVLKKHGGDGSGKASCMFPWLKIREKVRTGIIPSSHWMVFIERWVLKSNVRHLVDEGAKHQ